MLKFRVLGRNHFLPHTGKNTAYLKVDNWNDYSFRTLFYLYVHDDNGQFHDIGNVKIGFKGQTVTTETKDYLPAHFEAVPEGCFSIGQDVSYYQRIRSKLSNELAHDLLSKLCDLAYLPNIFASVREEEVLETSLLRNVARSTIEGQYSRVLAGYVALTDYRIQYIREESGEFSPLDIDFHVIAESTPSTNIHAIIGRNGVGKTTLLNGMIGSITGAIVWGQGKFYDCGFFEREEIGSSYFGGLVSVSFSAFDPFDPPKEQANPTEGTCYYYIGLKKTIPGTAGELKTLPELRDECVNSISVCLSQKATRERWRTAIETLESDGNFAEIDLTGLLSASAGQSLKVLAERKVGQLSSGHAIVLLTLTRLVETVQEKTLLLIDEPESHLHPPLLSAFVRALSDLLYSRNAIAIIATHSPVVLQEIPRSCVWKVHRSGKATVCVRPEIETFGENVGTLTREVFGLEVQKSGFHRLLKEEAAGQQTYEEIIEKYDDQLGMEARSILVSLLATKNTEDAG